MVRAHRGRHRPARGAQGAVDRDRPRAGRRDAPDLPRHRGRPARRRRQAAEDDRARHARARATTSAVDDTGYDSCSTAPDRARTAALTGGGTWHRRQRQRLARSQRGTAVDGFAASVRGAPASAATAPQRRSSRPPSRRRRRAAARGYGSVERRHDRPGRRRADGADPAAGVHRAAATSRPAPTTAARSARSGSIGQRQRPGGWRRRT